MPPKKLTGEKKKIVEDKTFGLKNKNKSKQVQKYIHAVETTIKSAGLRKGAPVVPTKKDLKEEKKAYEAELNSIFKPSQTKQNKAAPGVDPKTILCVFFKEGRCSKGAKCKFSHDLAIERKAERLDIYQDRRAAGADLDPNECMDDWDQSKLEVVVSQKDTKKNLNAPTDIVCKYFLEAIEKRLYGWFWECPGGGDRCAYRHALPPGFVFNSKKKAEEGPPVPLEEQIEIERARLRGGTPVTLETFTAWKLRKEAQKQQAIAEHEAQARRDLVNKRKSDKLLSGRQLFTYDPSLFVDDEEAFNMDDYEEETNRDDDQDGKQEADNYPRGGDEEGVSSTSVSTTLRQTTTTTTTTAAAIDESLFCDDDEDV